MNKIIRPVNNKAIKTVSNLITFLKLRNYNNEELDPDELLDIEFSKTVNEETGEEIIKTNRDSVRESYINRPEASEISEGNEKDLLFPDTLLAIPIKFFRRDIINYQSNAVYRYKPDFQTFFSDEILKIIRNPVFAIESKSKNIQGSYKKFASKPRVWWWSRGSTPNNNLFENRSLKKDSIFGKGVESASETFNQAKNAGAIIDISDFVISVSTNVGENGGNFSITLPPILSSFKDDGSQEIDRSSIDFSKYKDTTNYYAKSIVLRKSPNPSANRSIYNVKKPPKNEYDTIRQIYYFETCPKPNDIFFIAFEPLNGENRERKKIDDLQIPFNELPFFKPNLQEKNANDNDSLEETPRYFDMIGLLDRSSKTYSAEGTDMTITLSGRDVFKLLIEDGEYFFPLEFAGKEINGFFNNVQDTFQNDEFRALRRLNGKLAILDAFIDRTIEDSLTFVISQLSHIEIAPNELFSAYGDLRSKYNYATEFEVRPEGASDDNPEKFEIISKVEELLGAGIWQIVKLLIDDDGTTNSLKVRRLVDSSISTEQGSLINYIRKICQPPFVEFWGDTYGNQYFFIARRPPFTKSAIESMLEEIDQIDNIHFYDDDVIQEELSMSDDEAYSWYKLDPKGNFMGNSNRIQFAYLPAIFFVEYAEMFGNKALQITSNYVNYFELEKVDDNKDLAYLQEQAIADLRYLVEIHAYLPFVKKGTIVLRGEHRRIKKGIFIRNLTADEIYYVESVSNNYSVTDNEVIRNTTITVSHGIVDKIQKDGTRTFDKYFEIIDFSKIGKKQSSSNSLSPNSNNEPTNTPFTVENGGFSSPEPDFSESGGSKGFDDTGQSIQIQSETSERDQIDIGWSVNKSTFNYFIRGNQFSD